MRARTRHFAYSLLIGVSLASPVWAQGATDKPLGFPPPKVDYAKLCKMKEYNFTPGVPEARLAPKQKLSLARALITGTPTILRDIPRARRLLEELMASKNPAVLSEARVDYARMLLLPQNPAQEKQKAVQILKEEMPANPFGVGIILGNYYEDTGDFAQAETYYKQAAASGKSTAYVLLSGLYRRGDVVPPNENAADQMLKLAQNQLLESLAKGDCKSLSDIAKIYLTQNQGIVDIDLGIAWLNAAIQGGDTNAMNTLARIYYAGLVTERDLDKAIALWRQSAQKGNINAMNELGYELLSKGTSPEQKNEGVKWLNKAAAGGHQKAISHLAEYYDGGLGNPDPNPANAVKWLEVLASNGSADGEELFRLAEAYESGRGATQDFDKAFSLYERASQLGNTDALVKMGDFYRIGKGRDRQPIKSYRFYRLAASEGNRNAMAQLEQNYTCGVAKKPDKDNAQMWRERALYEGSGKVLKAEIRNKMASKNPADHAQALELIRRNIKDGDRDAMVYMAVAYHQGIGVDQDDETAARWIEAAKAEGEKRTEGLIALGKAYQLEEGLGKDAAKALAYLQEAQKLGDIEGSYELGKLYLSGAGGQYRPDIDKAEAALRYGAERGHADSMRKLAELLLKNRTGKTDEGLKWMEEAANAGDVEAMINLARYYTPKDQADKQAIEKAAYWLTETRNTYLCDSEDQQSYVEAMSAFRAVVGGGIDIEGLTQASERGDTRSMRKLARYYLYKPNATAEQKKQGLQWLQKAADAGDNNAMLDYGNAYASGLGVERSMTKAKEWWKKAADAGNAKAVELLK